MSIFKPVRILLLLCLSLSLSLGWGMAKALDYSSRDSIGQIAREVDAGSIDKTKYIEKCASCHLPIPAEVLPTETWQQILKKTQQHYGISIPQMDRLSTALVWSYLRTYSRSLLPNEALPFLVEDSRYFKALHPQVQLPKPTSDRTCLVCHPNGAQLNYRTVAGE
jgi:Dihaem cytochrome c